ncbi:hypothetical protein TI39_contig4202g00061 [Zymoseptoria brevis]|uniref:Uncharacterized protein n=1 Tax=Zymoseptoria brevis TaxID=1047168 RepID=A0A0F4GA94_9PEZI|nr:hypothetical protein TI39_contig4202g00061 [Zymoseptoria brevis]
MSNSPPLRIAGGTLRVRLSPQHEDDLILERKLIMAHCAAFAPLLRTPDEPGYCASWDKSELVKLPDNDGLIRGFTLALNIVDETAVLEGSRCDLGRPGYRYKNFQDSMYATLDWPCANDYSNNSIGIVEAATQHAVMFELLHGVKIDPGRLHIPIGNETYDVASWRSALGRISEMCARSEFYGCLPFVAVAVKELIEQASSFWEAVAFSPREWHQMAIKLRWGEVYFDSLRHIIAHTKFFVLTLDDDPSEDPFYLDLSAPDFQDFATDLQAKQAVIVLELKRSLHHLQLCESYSEYNNEKSPAWTTFLNLVKNAWPGRSAHANTMEKSEFLACAIWGQWLAEQESGDHVWVSTRRKAERSGPFQNGLMMLEKAAVSGNPPALFGSEVPRTIASIFGLHRRFKPAKKVDVVLTEIVHEAHDIVKSWFETCEEVQDRKTLTWRRSRFDVMARGDYNAKVEAFTFFPLDEEKVPWVDERQWGEIVAAAPGSLVVAEAAYVAAILNA